MNLLNLKLLLAVFCFMLLIPLSAISQKRQLKPKRSSKIESVDQFVNITYNLYNKVFVYDSLTTAGVEIPSDLEDELIKLAENDIDSLWNIMPDVFDDLANSKGSILKKGRATLNLNKAKKALKYCVNYVKKTLVGIKEEED